MTALSPAGGVLDSSVMETGSPLYETLRAHYLFAGLDSEVFDNLARQVYRKRLAKGEVLFRQGDAAECFYFVDTGLIELSLVSKTGEKKTLEVIAPGRTFAEAVTFMRGRRFPVTAEALDETILCSIPNAAYMKVLFADADASMRLLADISRHLHARVREIEHLTIQNARSRLIGYIFDHVTEKSDDEATVHLTLPRHIIASRLSIQPETLSRLLRNLADEGLISAEDRLIHIPSLSKLRPYN